jgi:hypothetical protein
MKTKQIVGCLIIIGLTMLRGEINAIAQLEGCWGLSPAQCQYDGPEFYECDGQYYPVLSFINSGTWKTCSLPPAAGGLTECIPGPYTKCHWTYTYVCDGRPHTVSDDWNMKEDGLQGVWCPPPA